MKISNYKVVSADLEKDRQVIIELWRQNLADTTLLEEKYDWHFLNNPFGAGQIWILEADGQPVGTTSLGMRPFKLGETVSTAGVACDLAVNKDHRFLQPALMLQRALLSNSRPEIQTIYGIPNPGGASVMKHVGYREFCSVHRYAKVLRVSHYLQEFGKFAANDSFLGRIADQGFAAAHSFNRRSKKNTQLLPSFDERFDDLWNSMSSQHPALTVRDRRFLTWRYQEFPLRQYKTLGLLSQDNSKLLGYLVYYVENQSAVCADLLVSGGAQDLVSLLASWAALAWNAGLASLSATCSEGILADTFFRQGFSKRSVVPASKSARTNRHELSKTLFTHDRRCDAAARVTNGWYYTEGDSPY